MKVFYSSHHALPLPIGHRFPISKYALLYQRVHQAQLPGVTLHTSEAATDEQLLLVHQADYLNRLISGRMSEKEMRRIGFPWSSQLVERSRHSVGGTIAACRAALRDGLAAHLAGGTHHAYPDHGEGYCVFNDVAVATRLLQKEQLVKRVIILDCDVHQGNGTAAIFKADPSVFTFSIHGQKNFPFHKEQSDLDIALPDGCDDACFLQALEAGILQAISKANFALAIYIAGADPFITDRFGRMSVSKKGLLERDRLVLEACREAGLRVAIVMGGGYAQNVQDIVDIHYQTIALAAKLAVDFQFSET